jgi:hypothetical protein
MTILTVRDFGSRAALDAALEERLSRTITASGLRAIMLSGRLDTRPRLSRARLAGAAARWAAARSRLR